MSLEPAFALLVGLLVLHQVPDALAAVGIGFVVAAGIGADRTGARSADPRPVDAATSDVPWGSPVRLRVSKPAK